MPPNIRANVELHGLMCTDMILRARYTRSANCKQAPLASPKSVIASACKGHMDLVVAQVPSVCVKSTVARFRRISGDQHGVYIHITWSYLVKPCGCCLKFFVPGNAIFAERNNNSHVRSPSSQAVQQHRRGAVGHPCPKTGGEVHGLSRNFCRSYDSIAENLAGKLRSTAPESLLLLGLACGAMSFFTAILWARFRPTNFSQCAICSHCRQTRMVDHSTFILAKHPYRKLSREK